MAKYEENFTSKHGIEYVVLSSDDYLFRPDDFYQIIKIFSCPDVYKFISKGVLKKYYPNTPFVEITAMDFVRFNKEHWGKGEQYRFFVRRKSDNILVGYINFEPRKDDVPERSLAKLADEPSFMKDALKIALQMFKKMGHPKTFGNVEHDNPKMNHLATSMGMNMVKTVTEDGKELLRYEIEI